MIFCKIAGMLILFLSGLLCAMHLNSELEGKKRQVMALEEWLRFAKGQIDCFAMPISDIFAASDGELLKACGYAVDVLPKNFEDFFSRIEFFDKPVKDAMLTFSQSFGNCYRDEQLRACERCISALSQRSAELSVEIPKRRKLHFTLCISAALAVAILLR